jgi:hypothetical protein
LNFLLKRRAVEEALKPFLKGQSLLNAVHLWEEKYSHKPTFALQNFLRDLCENTELAPHRSVMLQTLVAGLSALPDEKSFNKNTKMRPEKRTSFFDVNASTDLLMFAAFVDGLIDHMGAGQSTRVRLYILDNLGTLKVTSHQRIALQSWLNRIDPIEGLELSLTTMQQVINLVYVALCEFFGPVKADNILQSVLNRVQAEFPNKKVNRLL